MNKLTIVLIVVLTGWTTSGLTAQTEICNNEIDDNNDGLIDCYDPLCYGISPCEDFFIGQPSPVCEFSPPPIDMIELTELYRTDHIAYPIDQRSGVYVGDMNGDGIPDLVTRDNNPARIQIYSGDDGTILQSIPTGSSHPFGQVAIADVDRNGLGDIFHVERTARLARYEFGNPNPIWVTANNTTNDTSVGTPQIADLDGDGIPEVYVGGRVFDSATGTLYSSQSINNGGYAGGSNSDRFPITYDFFQEGDLIPGGGGATFGPEANGLEYAAGDAVYTFSFTPGVANSGTFTLASRLNDNSTTTGDGLTSIADINGDGMMDIAVMDGGNVYAWDPYTRMQIGSTFNVPNTTSGGRINLGDFNGDGDVELGFAGRNAYYVLELLPGNTFGTLWQRTGLDDGSQRTGSTLFDFDGDGSNEVVYSEEAFLYIYNGADGTELLRIPSEAGTRTEYPLVADVNGDGTAEIIVTAQDGNGPGFSGNGWVTVYTSANQPWVPTRPVWNQHGYNVVNINDDLTVPAVQQNPLHPALIDNYNSFLVQSPIRTQSGVGNFPAADATIMPVIDPITSEPIIDLSSCPNEVAITLEIDNQGAATLPGATPIAFYQGDPSTTQAVLIDVITIGQSVLQGQSVTVTRTIDISAFAGTTDLNNVFMVVNDSGFDQADLPFDFAADFPVTGTAECDYTNNLSSIGVIICTEICDDNGDNDGDGFIDEPNINAPSLTGCPGETLPQFTTDVGNSNGTYSVGTPNPSGTTVNPDGRVTLGTTVTTYPTLVDIIFDDGNCIDTVVVSINDTEAPQLVCPGTRTIPVDANCTAFTPDLLSSVQRSDNCSATNDITLSQSPAVNGPLALGNNTITITATDEAGNTNTCTTIIQAVDQIQPEINCVNEVSVVADAQCRGLIPDLSAQMNATDNCTTGPNLTYTQTPAANTLINSNASNFVQTVQLNVRDESNNQRTCSINVRILDQTPPDVTCPGGQTIALDPNNCVAIIPDYRNQVVNSDNCSSGAQIQLSQTPGQGTNITTPGITTVTITATDQAGNVNATGCTIAVTVVDQTPPILSCPGVIMADAAATDCSVTLIDYTSQVQSQDNCSNVSLSQVPAAGTMFNPASPTVTITAMDASGNSVDCVVTIQRKDVTPPTITCPATQQENVGADCQFTLTDYTGLATVNDNCTTAPTVSQSPAIGTVISADQTITLTARDEAGNTTTCTFQVELNDVTPPTITCPADQILGVDQTCDVPLPDYSTNGSTVDNCSMGTGISVTQSPAAGVLYSGDGNTITVTLTPADEANNVGTACTFIVTLEDMVEPSITCPASPQIEFVDGDCEASIPDFRGDVDVSSMCTMGGITLTQDPVPGTIVMGHNTTTLITITADDGNGNLVSCTFNYIVQDNTPPELTCPADVMETVDANCDFILPDYTVSTTVDDNCDANASLTFTQDPVATTVISGAGTRQTITITATDLAGNASMCMFDVVLQDQAPPVVTCPTSIAPLITNGSCEVQIPDYTMQSSATDNCSQTGGITLTQMPPANMILSGAGTTQTIIITATDESNNQATCNFIVTLEDNMLPEIACPANQELVVDAACETRVPDLIANATVMDNCTADALITVTQDIAANTVLTGHNFMQTVTLTADDGNGNTANCTVELTLKDRTPPTVTCPQNQDLILDANCMANLPDYSSQLVLNDNCTANGALTITQSPVANSPVTGANEVITVTFMVDDNNGNVTNCEFDVTLKDQTPPMVVCPTDQVIAVDADCMATIPNLTGLATPMDACTMSGMITLMQSPGEGTILMGHNDSRTITITANDGNGNTASCTFMVTSNDATPPSIVCPDNLDVAVDENCAFTLPDYTENATIADNCSAAVDITVSQSPLSTSLTVLNAPETITLMAEDGAGNTANCTFTVTPGDQTSPEIVCPSPQVIYFDSNCSVDLPDFTGLGTPSDNCTVTGNITVTQTPLEATTYVDLTPPMITVTLTAEDESGNMASCDFSVELQDTVRPIITMCPNDTIIPLDADCNGLMPDLTPRVIAMDNCTEAITIEQSPDPTTQYNGDGTEVTVTFTVTDSDGNSQTCTSLVTFEDQSPPNPVTCPENQTLTTDNNCLIELPDYRPGVTVLDNCRPQDEIVLTQLPSPTDEFSGNGTMVPVTITADDGNGNTATCMFTVTLVDDIPVNLACPGGQIEIASSTTCEATIDDYTNLATVSDLCSSPAMGVTFSQLPAMGAVIPLGQLNVPQVLTITATDINGNDTTCMFTVTMIDTLAPVLNCPAIQVRPLEEGTCQHFIVDYRDSIMAADNCTMDANIDLSQTPAPGTVLSGPDFTQEITITARDESNNISSCVLSLTIEDDVPPNIVCPDPDTLFVNGDCQAVIPDYTSAAERLDNCTAQGDVMVSQLPLPGTIISGDDTDQTITITAIDGSGNMNTCTFDINLQDTVPPMILCPGDQVITPDASCDALIGDYRSLATVMDNCRMPATAISITQLPAPGTVLNGQGEGRQVTLTSDDGNGNTQSCFLQVTLDDNVPPIITCPADLVVEADADCDYDLEDLRSMTSYSDNCTAVMDIVVTQLPGIGFTLNGNGDFIEAIFTADDGNGNTAQCSFLVTLDDVTPPTIVCPPNDTIFANEMCVGMIPDFTGAATVDDNCTPPASIKVSQSPSPGTELTGDETTQTITLTADDGNGNQENCTFVLRLLDDTPPTITCPVDQVIFTDADCEVRLPDYTGLANVGDNCTLIEEINVTQSPGINTLFSALGTNTVTLTADDGNGNTASCEVIVTVADNTDPELICPDISIIPGDETCTVTIADYRDSIIVTDNCAALADMTLTQVAPTGTMITGLGTSEDIIIMATDPSGNATNCIIRIEVSDTTRPIITCPVNTTLTVDETCAASIPDYTDLAIVADNCTDGLDIMVTQSPAAATMVMTEGTVTEITLTATDASGNNMDCVFEVTLIDEIDPEVICPTNDTISVDETCPVDLQDYTGSAQPTDNCTDPADIILTQSPATMTLSGNGTTQLVTITAEDESGNTSTCDFLVVLEDSTDPMINCPADQELTADDDCEFALPDYTTVATTSSTCDQGDNISVEQDPLPGTVISGHNAVQTITLTATDASGNSAVCTFEVTLIDRTDPEIVNCPLDQTSEVDAGCDFIIPDYWATTSATASDNCLPTGTTDVTATGDQIVYTQDPTPGTVLTGAFATQTITLTADDGNGNTISCSFELTLEDVIDPVIPVCANDTIANPDAACNFVLEDYRSRISPTDNCPDDGDLLITQTPPAGTQINGQGTVQEIVLMVTDASGNSTMCSFEVVLQDTISPSITCPAAKVEEVGTACEFALPDYTTEAVTDDNCTDPTTILVTQSPLPGTVFTNENTVIPVTLTADDGNGNTTSCTFEVTLDDVIPPVIACPGDTVIPVDATCMAELPDLISRTTTTDNCSPAVSGNAIVITQQPAPLTVFGGADGDFIEATLTADDSNGNTASCVVRITLADTIRPVITCPANDTIFTDGMCTGEVPDFRPQAVISDNCAANGTIMVSQLASPGTELMGDETLETITLTADDGNGNTRSCSFTLRLLDNDPPSIACPPTQTQFTNGGCMAMVLDYTDQATTMDNCTPNLGGTITVTQVPIEGTTFTGVQTQTVTLTADDGNGNTMDCTFQLEIEDGTDPTIICPPSTTIDVGTDCEFTLPDYIAEGLIDDNCGVGPLSVVQSPSPDSILNDLNTTAEVFLTVTDGNGNQATCSFFVTTSSDTPPPTQLTVILEEVPDVDGGSTATFDLNDALDPQAVPNTTNLDLDEDLQPGPGPYLVTYYESLADADAEIRQVTDPANYISSDGGVLIARLEDPATGCFTLSQVLLIVRPQGTSDLMDQTTCNRRPFMLEIDGMAMPASLNSTITHQWTIIDAGETGIVPANLLNPTEELLRVDTENLSSGSFILEYQFFEDYGTGPVVPSIPERITVEVLNVGTGTFPWGGGN